MEFPRGARFTPPKRPARVDEQICMGTIVVCAVLLIFGVGITLYHEDGWMLLLVAIALAAAFIFVAVS
jgi:hypothetical protein